MKNRILEFVTEKHKEKREQRKVPHFVTFLEINERLGGIDKQLLRELVREKHLEWGRTINDVWFAPKYTFNTDPLTPKNESEVAEISIQTHEPTKDTFELFERLENGLK